jgi:hypothetical protein
MKIKPTITAAFLFALMAFNASAQSLQPAVLSTTGGRYVFGQISSMRADQYMLDTQTGRLWQLIVSTNNSVSLQPVTYCALDGCVSLIPRDALEETQSAVKVGDVKATKSASQDVDKQKQPEPTSK